MKRVSEVVYIGTYYEQNPFFSDKQIIINCRSVTNDETILYIMEGSYKTFLNY